MATDGFSPLSLDDVKYMAERADNAAEQYGQQLVKFLRSNKDKFPNYEECVDADSPDMPAQKDAYRSKIFIGERYKRG